MNRFIFEDDKEFSGNRIIVKSEPGFNEVKGKDFYDIEMGIEDITDNDFAPDDKYITHRTKNGRGIIMFKNLHVLNEDKYYNYAIKVSGVGNKDDIGYIFIKSDDLKDIKEQLTKRMKEENLI